MESIAQRIYLEHKMSQSFKDTFCLIKADMLNRCAYENKTLNTIQVIKFLLNNAAISTVIYRLQIFFYCNHLSFIAAVLKYINSLLFTVDIDSKTKIDGGFFMMHASFMCIGANVKIGRNCMMAHQNSIYPSPFFSADGTQSAQGPTLGDHVILGAGATLCGNIVLGNNVQISINASVDTSFPDGAVLFGVPARNMAKATVEVTV
jgi:serine O-acetyltransferase